jgi:hypothetical protein
MYPNESYNRQCCEYLRLAEDWGDVGACCVLGALARRERKVKGGIAMCLGSRGVSTASLFHPRT